MRRLLTPLRNAIVLALAIAVGLSASAGARNVQPRKNVSFTGFTSESQNNFRAPVSFSVSRDGKRLVKFTWAGTGCAGMFGGPGNVWSAAWLRYQVGTIAVRRTGTFAVTNVKWTGRMKADTTVYTKTIRSTVSGRFTSADTASGTISYTETISPSSSRASCSGKVTFTAVTSRVPAGDFRKLRPANNASNQSTAPTLSWTASRYAASYRYCIDKSANRRCDGKWVSTASATSARLGNLTPGATYSWQVQAVNAHGAVNADRGTWFAFKVSSVAKPRAGTWTATGFTGASGSGGAGSITVTRIFFTVTPSQTAVASFGIGYEYSGVLRVPPTGTCSGADSSSEHTATPISNGQFQTPSVTPWSGAGSAVFHGSFDSATQAHGTAQASVFITGTGCWMSGTVNTNTFSWTAHWTSS